MKRLFPAAAAALLLTACCCGGNSCKTAEPAATPVVYGATIDLPAPDLTRGTTIGEALQNRRSWREYTDAPLSLEELSGVLWAAAGINRPENAHLTAPSAMGLYPIRLYALFADGIYRYEAEGHRLVRIAEGDRRAASGTQAFVATAPLNLVYAADLSVYDERPIPAEHVRYLCGQDAAGYAENVNLYTAATGLRSITRGSVSPELLGVLGLEGGRWFVALAQSVGK